MTNCIWGGFCCRQKSHVESQKQIFPPVKNDQHIKKKKKKETVAQMSFGFPQFILSTTLLSYCKKTIARWCLQSSREGKNDRAGVPHTTLAQSAAVPLNDFIIADIHREEQTTGETRGGACCRHTHSSSCFWGKKHSWKLSSFLLKYSEL